MVICSRIEEYKNNQTPLILNTSIHLKPLQYQQIENYLTDVGSLDLWKKSKRIPSLISNDPNSLGLISIPLFLNIVVASKGGIDLDYWLEIESENERIYYLFNAYIQQMKDRGYKGNYAPPSWKKSLDWLSWLAYNFDQENETEILIERIQPKWLSATKKRWIKKQYSFLVGLIFGILSFLIIVAAVGFISIKLIGIFGGIITALIVGVVYGFFGFGLIGFYAFGSTSQTIKPVTGLEFSLKNVIRSTLVGLLLGIISWLVLGTMSHIFSDFYFIWKETGIPICLFLGIVFSLIINQEFLLEKKTIQANQGIFQSVQYSVFFALLGGIVTGLFTGFINKSVTSVIIKSEVLQSKISKLDIIVFGIILGLFFFFTQAGIASIQHFALRLVLWANGYVPFNYAAFLDYATDRLFLQKIGGSYRFLHEKLRNHFIERKHWN